MCCHRHHSGIALIILGLGLLAFGAVRHVRGSCHRMEFERHVAEVCVRAAEQVHR